MTNKHLLIAAIAALPALPCAAEDSFRLTLSGKNHDMPRVLLENTSTGHASILEMKIELGDTDYNFDRTGSQTTSRRVHEMLMDPDHRNGFVRSDLLTYEFSGLAPGAHAGFVAEMDK